MTLKNRNFQQIACKYFWNVVNTFTMEWVTFIGFLTDVRRINQRKMDFLYPFLMGVIPDFLFRTALVAVSCPKNLLKLILKNFEVSSEKGFQKVHQTILIQ